MLAHQAGRCFHLQRQSQNFQAIEPISVDCLELCSHQARQNPSPRPVPSSVGLSVRSRCHRQRQNLNLGRRLLVVSAEARWRFRRPARSPSSGWDQWTTWPIATIRQRSRRLPRSQNLRHEEQMSACLSPLPASVQSRFHLAQQSRCNLRQPAAASTLPYCGLASRSRYHPQQRNLSC